VVLVALSTILAGCATAPSLDRGSQAVVRADTPFNASGRLSARHGSQAAAANFRWMHAPGRDELTLASPLGSTLAQLQGSPREVTLTLPDGRIERAPDWEALTATVLGAPIPVRGLASWMRASPHPGSDYAVERDGEGRIAVLRQDGWEIVYGYGEGERVRSLRLTYPDTEIRLVIDAFEAP
jgi:outer membrane lipoprotein LolB